MLGFVLAHLSDAHLPPLPQPSIGALVGKRLLGYAHWQRRRRYIHRAEIVAQIVADLRANTPDHIAVTGDLVNLSLPQEYPQARAWLESLGQPHDVTVVPGNHDVYVPAAIELPRLHWSDYLRGDAAEAVGFPLVRRRGPISLIGLSTAVPTALFMATGRVGSAQLGRLADALAQEGAAARFRVVLIHHPPRLHAKSFHKRLLDSHAVREVLARHGAELVIHGHDHVQSLEYLDGSGGRIPVVGVPSASASGGHDDDAAYNLYRIDGNPGQWHCELVARGLGSGGRGMIERARISLSERR